MSAAEAGRLHTQTPELAWSGASAAGELHGLGWVGVGHEPSYCVRSGPDGLRWHGQERTSRLPPPVAEAIARAREDGETTAWDGLDLILARPEWLVASRGLLWTPSSPTPKLLTRLVESVGIEPSLHRGDPDRLRRLAALLPRWAPRRGDLGRAVEVLEAAGAPTRGLLPPTQADPESEDTAPSATAGEAFAARSGTFWARRAVAERAHVLRISGGLLRFQPRNDAATALRREDLLVAVGPTAPSPRDLFRLLPAWTVPRPVAAPASKE